MKYAPGKPGMRNVSARIVNPATMPVRKKKERKRAVPHARSSGLPKKKMTMPSKIRLQNDTWTSGYESICQKRRCASHCGLIGHASHATRSSDNPKNPTTKNTDMMTSSPKTAGVSDPAHELKRWLLTVQAARKVSARSTISAAA